VGEAPARTLELSKAVAELRQAIAACLPDKQVAVQWLLDEVTLSQAAAEQIGDYVADTVAVLGTVPSQEKIIAERFFDEAGGMQMILHSPWGGRINRALGLAFRKRVCVRFFREFEAGATHHGHLIFALEAHSIPFTDA